MHIITIIIPKWLVGATGRRSKNESIWLIQLSTSPEMIAYFTLNHWYWCHENSQNVSRAQSINMNTEEWKQLVAIWQENLGRCFDLFDREGGCDLFETEGCADTDWSIWQRRCLCSIWERRWLCSIWEKVFLIYLREKVALIYLREKVALIYLREKVAMTQLWSEASCGKWRMDFRSQLLLKDSEV